MRSLLQAFGMVSKVNKAKDIGGLTDFLVNNPVFRQLAVGFHQGKKDWLKNTE
jgi:hypothetical protein